MSVLVMGLAWQAAAKAGITSAQRLVLLALADHASDDGECWPGIRGVAAKTGLSRRGVQLALGALKRSGFVAVESRHRSDGGQTSNRFRLTLPVAEAQQIAQGGAPSCAGGAHPPAPHEPSKEPSDAKRKTARASRPTVQWDADAARFIVSPDRLARWREDYPSLDVGRELTKAANWQTEHPLKKQAGRFLVNWLNRAAGNGHGGNGGGRRRGRHVPAPAANRDALAELTESFEDA